MLALLLDYCTAELPAHEKHILLLKCIKILHYRFCQDQQHLTNLTEPLCHPPQEADLPPGDGRHPHVHRLPLRHLGFHCILVSRANRKGGCDQRRRWGCERLQR